MKKSNTKTDVRLVDIDTLLKHAWTIANVEDSEIHGRIVVLSFAAENLFCSFPPDGRPTFYRPHMSGGVEELTPPDALRCSGIALESLPKPH